MSSLEAGGLTAPRVALPIVNGDRRRPSTMLFPFSKWRRIFITIDFDNPAESAPRRRHQQCRDRVVTSSRWPPATDLHRSVSESGFIRRGRSMRRPPSFQLTAIDAMMGLATSQCGRGRDWVTSNTLLHAGA